MTTRQPSIWTQNAEFENRQGNIAIGILYLIYCFSDGTKLVMKTGKWQANASIMKKVLIF